MKTLVLCIDRDDDVGSKTGRKSPILGRKENLRTAVELGLEDPEDSDVNTILSAIRKYDELKEEKKDAEIATICGSSSLGEKADKKLASQLDSLINELKPESVIVVTDGAGDETILPIIQSRIKIDGVNRVVVKQHENIESTIYILRKALDDEKVQVKVFIPMALIILVFGIFLAFGYTGYGLAAILITVGCYWLLRAAHVGERAIELFHELREGILTSKFSLFTSTLAVIIVISSLIYSYTILLKTQWATIFEAIFIFVMNSLWVILLAIIIRGLGVFLDVYVKHGKIMWSFYNLFFSLIALGLILYGLFYFISYAIAFSPVFLPFETYIFIAFGLGIGIFGGILTRYAKKKAMKKASVDER
ncbi:MAG: DUF373 family protein [Candidatus Thermoplasmatota archaeon]